ncbi:MAG: MoxR-like ATPase [Rhodothermales bacterium]|jgi:MoxR-like ATPase
MPRIVVQQGYSKKNELEVTAAETVIGRVGTCDFVIPDGDISRQHAKICLRDGVATIEDMGSRNGTFLNSERVDGLVGLKHLDVVQIGKTVVVFQDPESTVLLQAMDADQTIETYTFTFLRETMRRVQENVEKVFKGKPNVVRNLLLCLFADGHALLEDAPGVGKSMLGQAVAKSIQGIYKRIPFTPDMLPSDIIGVSIFNEKSREFEFMAGPIFGNVILADEINRTTPRTQSSLLECMTDAVVTVDGKPNVLPKPFFVIATQNPVDHKGTYSLPEAQLDRFLMRLSIGYPTEEVEMEILRSQSRQHPIKALSHVVRAVDLMPCQALVRQVHVSDAVNEFIVKLVQATRTHAAFACGCSPRASLHLSRATQALAAYREREYVTPADVRELAIPVLAHRLSLRVRAEAEWGSAGKVLESILADLPVPKEEVTP